MGLVGPNVKNLITHSSIQNINQILKNLFMSNSRNGKNNLVMVVSKSIRYFKIPVTERSIREQIKTHPDYPALKSVSDTLDHFKVKNYPIRITQNELKEVDQPFIAHTYQKNGELVFVEKKSGNRFVVFDNSKNPQLLSEEGFSRIFSGVVILIEPSPEAGEPDFKSKKQAERVNTLWLPVLAMLMSVTLLITLVQSDLTWNSKESLLFITKLLGLGASLLLVAKDLKSDLSFIRKICSIGKKADCDSVTSHPSATIVTWVKWSDMGLIYFLSGLLLISHGSLFLGIIKLLSISALPYLFYSLYLQAFVIKKWCPLCLIVLTVIASEFAITITEDFAIASPAVSQSLVLISTIATLVLLTKFSIQTSRIARNEKIKYKRLIRTPGVIECLLKREQQIELTINSRSLLFGHNTRDTKRVSVFLSLDCPYCGEVFQKLTTIVDNSDKLQLHIVPVTKNELRQKQFTVQLYQTYLLESHQAALTLLEHWYSKAYQPDPDQTHHPTTEEKEFMTDNSMMALKNQITGFPAVFIEGYKLPENYQLSEISELAAGLPDVEFANTQAEMII